MGAPTQPSRRGIVAINITPMVDIILVLLVIFMVTSTTLNATSAIPVDKPEAATGDPGNTEHPTLVVTCDASGMIHAGDGYAPGLAGVHAAARDALRKNSDLQALINCDRAAPIDTLVDVLDALRSSGVVKYAIATRPEQESSD